MKYIKQFTVIAAVTFAAEGIKWLLPLPIPASIYGLVLMLAALNFKLIKLESVEETAIFLTQIMPVMFIPAAAGLMDSWADLSQMLLPALAACVLITVVVMVVTGRVTQALIKRKGGQGR